SVHCGDEGAVGPPACPAKQTCRNGLCVSGAGAKPSLGTPCAGDRDCADGDLCLDPADFGGGSTRLSSRACCSSRDCDRAGDYVGWPPPGGGGNFCMSAAVLGRTDLGESMPGDKCDAGSDCRSGACSTGGRCSDPCCSDTNCTASAEICNLGDDG